MQTQIADRLQGLTELTQLDFHTACQQAVKLLYPWPLSSCQVVYYDDQHNQHLLGDTQSMTNQPAGNQIKLGEFAAGKGKLYGRLAPLAEDNRHAMQLLEAVCRQLTSSWSKFQLGRRLIRAKTTSHTSEKLREWQFKLSGLMHQAEDIRAVYQLVHDSLHSLMFAENVLVAITDRKQGLFRFIYSRDRSLQGHFIEGESFPVEELSDTLTGTVFRRGSAMLLNSRSLRRMTQLQRVTLRGTVPTSWLGVPFTIDEHNDGIMILQTYEGDPVYQESDKALLITASRYISMAHQHFLAEQRLFYQANHDPLTKLLNRKRFMHMLEQQLTDTEQATVMFIDLDDFKLLNDRHGHHLGDLYLKRQAKRLQSLLAPDELASRLGGDEFAILLPGSDYHRAVELAQALCATLSRPFAWEHQTISGHVSIGMAKLDVSTWDNAATHSGSRQLAERLLNQADHAMYHAKRDPGSRWRWFDASLQADLERRTMIHGALEQALGHNGLTLHYQPIYNSADLELQGFEALLRWEDPTLGRVSPGEFIPLAEESGLIMELDLWVLEQAAKQLQQWHQQGNPIRLAVNVSSQHFSDPLFPERIARLFKTYQLPHQSLLIELTEHALLSHIETAREVIHKLSRIGVRLALDDFGTGFSSLSYLNSLPFDVLKIDQSFIKDLPEQDGNTGRIVSTIISLAQSMGMVTIAEGVETEKQQQCLQELGCDRLQGFLLGRPMPLEQAQTVLEQSQLAALAS